MVNWNDFYEWTNRAVALAYARKAYMKNRETGDANANITNGDDVSRIVYTTT